jgi:hypothetical protein
VFEKFSTMFEKFSTMYIMRELQSVVLWPAVVSSPMGGGWGLHASLFRVHICMSVFVVDR